MQQTTLGAELTVGTQGLGCMGMSEFYGATDDAQSIATIHRALDLGANLLDTADMYGSGANEELVGTAVRGRRDAAVVATKFGIVRDPADATARGFRGDRDYVHRACDASLLRLGVETIDLYYLHRVDVRVPIEETVGAMGELVQAGKVRALGLSEVTATELRRAHSVHPITAVQSEWSLWSRDVEDSVVPLCADLGVAFVPYAPLGRGFLTGAVSSTKGLPAGDFRHHQPRFASEAAATNEQILVVIKEIAEAHGITPAQVALAWVHHRSEQWHLPVVPIPGTKRIGRLEENLAAAEVILTAPELEQLEELAAVVEGDRYADMSFTSAGGRS